jgi:ketosteroid isomerase-like protein
MKNNNLKNYTMKIFYYLLIVAAILAASCQPKTEPVVVDAAAVKTEVAAALDKYHDAYRGKDLTVLMSLFADDLLFCGPAPKEFWDKQTMYSMFERPFADSTFVISYSIIDREIKIVKDGNSAISTESYFLSRGSTKIPLRQVCHLVKTDGSWMIDYFSASYIPNRSDMGKINAALE